VGVGWIAVAPVVPDRLAHDVTSYLTPLVLHESGIGVPYADVFDIKPPGVLMILDLWTWVFGTSTVTIAALDAVAIGGVMLLTDSIARRVAPKPIGAIAVTLVAVSYMLGGFKSVLFQTETLGLVLLLSAFRTLIVKERRNWHLVLAGSTAFLATQMKDIYLPSFAGLIFIIWASSPGKGWRLMQIAWYGVGAFLSLTLVATYLVWLGAGAAYLEVVLYKVERYGIPLWLLLFAALLIGVAMWASANTRQAAIRPDSNRYPGILGVVSFISVLAGVLWQRRIPIAHYGEPLFVMFVLMLLCLSGIVLSWWHVGTARSVVVGLLTVAMAAPVVADFSWRVVKPRLVPGEQLMSALTPEDPKTLIPYSLMASYSSPEECLIHTYGWGAGATYVYTQRRPCTRFFLPNLMTETQKQRYVQDILADPPVVVKYSPLGADLDVEAFEQDVFAWERVLTNCYRLPSEDPDGQWSIYVSERGQNLTECVKRFSA